MVIDQIEITKKDDDVYRLTMNGVSIKTFKTKPGDKLPTILLRAAEAIMIPNEER